MKYAIFAPVVTAEELAETRHRFQRNASLLFSVSVLATTRATARIDTHTYSPNTLTSPTRSYSLSQVLKTSSTHPLTSSTSTHPLTSSTHSLRCSRPRRPTRRRCYRSCSSAWTTTNSLSARRSSVLSRFARTYRGHCNHCSRHQPNTAGRLRGL